MRQKYFGFYWTLPVPWIGFTRLPPDVDEAAKCSRTIRYSRWAVWKHVREDDGELVREFVFMESAPDRGSKEMGEEFERILNRAVSEQAYVAVVDFSGHNGWRRHEYLQGEKYASRRFKHPKCVPIPVEYDAVHGTGFNPFDNFEQWREATRRKIAGKSDHRARVLALLNEIDGGFSNRARGLNLMGEKTHNGKQWTPGNLRKFVQASQVD